MNRRFIFAAALTALVAVSITGLLTAQPAERERPEARQDQPQMRREAPRPGPEQAEAFQNIRQMHAMFELVERMRDVSFDPSMAAVIAVNGIKDLPAGKPEQKAETLEKVLRESHTQGVRNAIHFALKDLYLATNRPERATEHLRAIVLENDERIRAAEDREDDDGDDDDDDEDDDD